MPADKAGTRNTPLTANELNNAGVLQLAQKLGLLSKRFKLTLVSQELRVHVLDCHARGRALALPG